MSTIFYLLRHGQTDWNIQRRYQGHIDIPLNEVGINQAKNAAKLLKGESFDQLFCSDLQRAIQTANEVANNINLPIQKDSRLREINQGQWEGKFIDEVLKAQPLLVNSIYDSPYQNKRPGGESIGEVADRVWSCLNEIACNYPSQKIIIVSHGLAIATALCKHKNIPLTQAKNHIPDNCEFVIIYWND